MNAGTREAGSIECSFRAANSTDGRNSTRFNCLAGAVGDARPILLLTASRTCGVWTSLARVCFSISDLYVVGNFVPLHE